MWRNTVAGLIIVFGLNWIGVFDNFKEFHSDTANVKAGMEIFHRLNAEKSLPRKCIDEASSSRNLSEDAARELVNFAQKHLLVCEKNVWDSGQELVIKNSEEIYVKVKYSKVFDVLRGVANANGREQVTCNDVYNLLVRSCPVAVGLDAE